MPSRLQLKKQEEERKKLEATAIATAALAESEKQKELIKLLSEQLRESQQNKINNLKNEIR